MTSMIVTFWLTCGITMWFGMLGEAGLPDRWISNNSRVSGWADWLLVTIPLCLAAGPLGWLVFLWTRLRP